MAMKSQKDEMLERMKQFQLSDEEHDKHLSILVDCVDQAKSVLPHNDHQVTLSKMVTNSRSQREGALKGWSQVESVPLLPIVTNDATSSSYIVLDGSHRVAALQNMASKCDPPETVDKATLSGCILTRVNILP